MSPLPGFALTLLLSSPVWADLPVLISPADPNIQYVGRFDLSDPNAPRCAWPASTIAFKFTGSAASITLKDAGDRWQVEVDGTPASIISTKEGVHTYPLATGLPQAIHSVRVVKATEPLVGATQFLGIQLNDGATLLPSNPQSRLIEVIGDSISAGYGNEAHSQQDHFSPQTENAYYSYGAIAARALSADYDCIASTGRKLAGNNTLPEIYGRILPGDADSKWDFSGRPPDVIVISLGTSDFLAGVPDEYRWTTAYKAFLSRLRSTYPHANIYCAIGPMMGDWSPGKPLTTLRGYLSKIVADTQATEDTKVQVLDFGIQDAKNGFGADWHPTVKTHQLMADQLVAVLRRDLGW